MRILLTCFVIALALTATAQKIRFTDSRNYWVTKGSGFDCILFNRFYYWGADTTIHGLTYRSMLTGVSANPTICPAFDYSDLSGYFLREDTIAGKVYYVHYGPSAPDTFEHTLYDYKLNVGDTIRYYSSSGGVYTPDSVISIDSTIISGVSHRIINMQNTSGWGTANYTIIEGLGCVSGPLTPTFLIACFEYEEEVICFSQSSYSPAVNALAMNLCSGVVDTFRNAGGCATLAIKERSVEPPSPTIFPNPANDNINISFPSSVESNTQISLYDLTGRCIYKSKAEEQRTTINTSSWNNGVYILAIQDNTGILKKEKIIIMH